MKNRAIVIGGSKGIGYETAIKMAQNSWDVTIVGSNEERLQEAVNKAKEVNIDLASLCCDVRNEEQVKEMFRVISQCENVKAFVNCVGKNYSALLVKKKESETVLMPYDKWKECIDINLNTVFLCSREEANLMMKKGTEGVIINISTSLRNGGYGQSPYLAAKSAIVSLTSSWALELAKYNIRIGCVAPGAIEGEALINACKRSESHKYYMDKLREQIPLKRFATEEEVADTILFMINNKYFTGEVIDLDGGSLPKRVVL
jgi:3-oxoacyl-[acyl-carrier protein] reductase